MDQFHEFLIVFFFQFSAGTSDDDENDEENEIEDITDISDDGIIFKEETKNELFPRPPPSRSISIVEMTQSKFWKDISVLLQSISRYFLFKKESNQIE